MGKNNDSLGVMPIPEADMISRKMGNVSLVSEGLDGVPPVSKLIRSLPIAEGIPV